MKNSIRSTPNTLIPLLTATLFGCVAGLIGCSTPPERADRLASEAGFSRAIHTGTQFEHIVYLNHMDTGNLDELHIYIEGDGTPWIAGRYPAEDPTPSQPLALKLMRDDPAPALYLGRPCYFGLSTSNNCTAEYWTSKRYSTEVVTSMLGVIEYYQEAYQVQKIVLIGYSGGGTLAVLISRELQGEKFIMTLAANLDTDLWTELRGFLPLSGSLNPVNFHIDTAGTPQLHLAGMQDEVVPIAVTQSYATELDPLLFRYYPTFDHACCWLELWPEILEERPWSNTSIR